jgi:pantoate--beta-alanine ligase
MHVVRTVAEVRDLRLGLAEPLGFVPTMGYLHEGHISLVRRALAECRSVAVSIFVNPTQFGPQEDFDRYPRDLVRDEKVLREAGVHLLFAPDAREMYPEGFSTYVEVAGLGERLDGSSRPGHFRGVATVVAKLLNIVRPTKAYFGQKDYQQSVVVRRMVADLNFPVEVVVCPTVREPDGLAMSSRNVYLNPDERRAASVLYRALQAAKELWETGERSGPAIKNAAQRVLEQEPLARVEYVSVVHPDTLVELERIEDKAVVLLAVWIGTTRLIDNIIIG